MARVINKRNKMKTPKQKVNDIIISVYRSQLKKFKKLSVYDDNGNFLYGQETEFGTKVTPIMIENTQKRLDELTNRRLIRRGFRDANKSNGKVKQEL